MNLEQLFQYYGLAEDKLETAAKWIELPLTNPVSKLGAGQLGEAYDLHNGLALKVTSDTSEAKTSMHLLGKYHQNIAKITKIAKYTTRKGLRYTTYFVLQKKYIDNGLARSIYIIIAHALGIERERRSPRATTNTFTLIPKDEELLRHVVRTELNSLGISGTQSHLVIYTKLFQDIRAGLEFLRNHGIRFEDAHFANILFDKDTNNFVITDLGGDSSSPHDLEPEEIAEAVFVKLIERAAHRVCAALIIS